MHGSGNPPLNCLGIFKYKNGNRYDGYWSMNKKHGDGRSSPHRRGLLLRERGQVRGRVCGEREERPR